MDKSPRYLIKKSLVAHILIHEEDRKLPTFLVVDNRRDEKTMSFFVWAVKARSVVTTTEHSTPYSMSMFESDDVDVQLEPDGEFISAASALETNKARFESWQDAWARVGIN
jgi:hypothetical protein